MRNKWVQLHSGQTQDACAVPDIILQKKIRKIKKSRKLKVLLSSQNLTPFWNLKIFTLSMSWTWNNCHAEVLPAWNSVCRDNVMHRFRHTYFALVNFWTDSNFKALKGRMWRSFLHLTAMNRWNVGSAIRIMLGFSYSQEITGCVWCTVYWWKNGLCYCWKQE